MDTDVKYEEIQGIKSLECVCALSFPDSATDFQKAAILLAHMMAAVREIVMKGGEVHSAIISRIYELSQVLVSNAEHQK